MAEQNQPQQDSVAKPVRAETSDSRPTVPSSRVESAGTGGDRSTAAGETAKAQSGQVSAARSLLDGASHAVGRVVGGLKDAVVTVGDKSKEMGNGVVDKSKELAKPVAASLAVGGLALVPHSVVGAQVEAHLDHANNNASGHTFVDQNLGRESPKNFTTTGMDGLAYQVVRSASDGGTPEQGGGSEQGNAYRDGVEDLDKIEEGFADNKRERDEAEENLKKASEEAVLDE